MSDPSKDAGPPAGKLAETVAGPSKDESKDKAGAKKLPQLGALEDDDEFEDFPASAEQSGNVVDALKAADGPGDHLWEDNWDDDDIEDDFTKQLRTAINERAGADDAMKE
ncbi:hypothetical protein EHS25_009987 [Saitozyma podzolica]|uniref:26S proteasome complex subunit SEM1 n=1 Tax=Saitozyma podzolica TaxID=1890683 RepID=A0A427YIA4_9TREE|nr:hypothetical protein EHS25_009987 [Saitozyma podzolica]